MMRLFAVTCLFVSCLAGVAQGVTPAKVSFELITAKGMSGTDSQQWYQALTNLGVTGLRIRSGTPGEEAGIEELGTPSERRYKVTGILGPDNVLRVPGGKFTVKDSGSLRKWIENLGDLGKEGVTQPRAAFGLTPRQLEEVNDDLKRSVSFATKGQPADMNIRQIAAKLKVPLIIDPAARRALAEVQTEDELENLSCGSALAILVRPAGLVMRPRREPGGPLEYRLEKRRDGEEAWPAGWKPEARPADALPALYEMLNVEIKEIPVSEALDALSGRLKAPFVFDRAALALHKVDPAQVQANVPSKRTSYSQVLNRVLSQARLKYELRADEAQTPFIWITTVKPTP